MTNPVRRAINFALDFVSLLADGASIRDAAIAGWRSSGYGR